MGHRQHALRRKDQAGGDGTIAAFHGGLTSFSKFVEGLPIQGTVKYTGHFSGPKSHKGRELIPGCHSGICAKKKSSPNLSHY